MNTFLNLKNTEKKAFRTTFEDGILDLQLGLLLLPAVLINVLNLEDDSKSVLRIALMILIYGAIIVISFWILINLHPIIADLTDGRSFFLYSVCFVYKTSH